MYYDEDDVFGDEVQLANEVNVMQRVGYDFPTATPHEMHTDPIKRFKVFVNAIAVNLSKGNIISISSAEIQNINEYADKLESLGRASKYKNPIGFVLGYTLVRKNKISKKTLDHIKTNIDEISPDKHINIEDVLRYGRLWLNLR